MATHQNIEAKGGNAPREEIIEVAGGIVPDAPAKVPGRALAPVAASPLDLPAEQFRAGLDRRKENRAALMLWVRAALVAGVDYGCIPTRRGPSKPSLWKPGAEKICGMLGVTVHFPTLHDYEQAALHGVDWQHIILRCELHDAAGRVVADGVGARSLQQDGGDINKALKMAEKSAHIDATLRMAGLSEVFTQDIEDMIPQGNDVLAGKPAAHPSPSSQAGDPNGSGPVPSGANGATISAHQRQGLLERIHTLALDPERVKAWIRKASRGQIQDFEQLTPALFRTVDARLEDWAERTAIEEQDHE